MTTQPPARRLLGKELHRLDVRIGRMMRQSNAHRELEELSGSNFRILRFLEEHEDRDVYQKDLEAEFGITRSTASRVLGLMEKKGFISRESVAGDRRLKRLTLTQRARSLGQELRREGDALDARLLRGFSAQEVAQLYRFLDRLLENLEG